MADLDLNRLLRGGMDLAAAFGRGDDAYNSALAKRAQVEGMVIDARNKRDAAMAKNDLVGLLMESGEPADRQRALAVRGGIDPKLLGFGGKTNEAFTLSPGSKRFDAAGKVIAEVPFAPANMQYVDVPDGYGGAVKALFDPRGGSFRQPQYGGFSTYEDGSPVTLSSSVGPNGQPFNFDPSLTPDQRRVVMADISSGGASDNYRVPPSSTHQFGRTPPKQKDAPSGYQWDAAGGSLTPIPGGPADRKANPTAADQAQGEMGMRKELASRVKDDRGTMAMFQNVQNAAANTSAAGDLSLIFAYMKMLDPGSVVREQEFANAQNAAGVPDQIRNMWNRALRGERLNPRQRGDFLNQARLLASAAQDRLTAATREYQGIADQYGYDATRATGMADFRDVTGNVQAPQAQSVASPTTQAEFDALPSGAIYIDPDDGQTYRKR